MQAATPEPRALDARRRDGEVFADLLGKIVVDFVVEGHARCLPGGAVDVNRVVPPSRSNWQP
jgi:hypothetical protein